jgi:hypothetical protein
VLFPAPAMPVTTTRRPTGIARGMSLISGQGSLKQLSGTSP